MKFIVERMDTLWTQVTKTQRNGEIELMDTKSVPIRMILGEVAFSEIPPRSRGTIAIVEPTNIIQQNQMLICSHPHLTVVILNQLQMTM